MSEAMEIRSEGALLFVLTPDGQIELKRGDWLHRIDIAESLRTGKPVVTRTYVGAKCQLTRSLEHGRINCN